MDRLETTLPLTHSVPIILESALRLKFQCNFLILFLQFAVCLQHLMPKTTPKHERRHGFSLLYLWDEKKHDRHDEY